jgi:hypothetical protein
MTSRIRLLLTGGAICFANFLANPPQVLSEERISFDFAAAHEFTGFGLQVWPQTDHRTERDAMLRDLNVRWVRFSLTPEIPADQLKEHMSVTEVLNVITKNEDQQQSDMLRQFREELTALKLQCHFVLWQMPPPWCISVHGNDGKERLHVDPGHIADFSNWVAAHLLYLRRFGIVPAAIELINEPDGVSNTNYTPEEYDSLLCSAKANFAEHGLKTGIEGPGVSTGFSMRPYLEELERTGHISSLQQLSWHDYDTAKHPEPAGFAGVPLSLLSQAHGLPLVVTEFTSMSPRWSKPPYDAGPETRSENNASNSGDFAISVAGEALKLIADGANQIFFWQAEDPSWTQDAFGLLDPAGKPKPAVNALLTFLPLLSKDTAAVGPQKIPFGLAGVAFRTSKSAIVVLSNLSSTTHALQLDSKNGRLGTKISGVRGFDVNGPMNDKAARQVRYANDLLNVELPARSVLSVVLSRN